MYFKFILHLLLIVAVTICVTGVISYERMTTNARNYAERYLQDELDELYAKNRTASGNVQALSRLNNDSMLARARAAEEIISLRPGILEDQEALQGLCNRCNAESIIMCDARGTVLASTPEQIVGQYIGDDYQSLLGCADGSPPEMTLLALAMDNSGRLVRYAAVKMRDVPAVIILSYYLEFEQAARSQSGVMGLVSNASIGVHGFLIAFDRGTPYATRDLPATEAELRSMPLDTFTEQEFNGVAYFVYARRQDGLRLIAFLPASEYYNNRASDIHLQVLSIIALLVAVLVGVHVLLKRFVLTPLSALNEAVKRISCGHFDERTHSDSTAEFKQLTQSINLMLDTMRSVDDLEEEKKQNELALARSIKTAVLPKVEEITDRRRDFSLAVSLVQADTVGGDFYDCLMLDDDHLFFAVGSIAEQGVPAALYMMRGLSIIRNYINVAMEPTKLAQKVNYHVSKGDNANIVVSMLLGVFCISTGKMRCVNAGQHAPLLRKLGENYEVLPIPVSPGLGKSSTAAFKQYEFTMEPGDRFFACTCSLTCMLNSNKELFGEQRLMQALHEVSPSVKDVTYHLRSHMLRFMRNDIRRSDYTALVLELPGPHHSEGVITVTSQTAGKALSMIESAMQEVFASPHDITHVLDETSRVISALPADVEVRVVARCTENHARVILTYNGEEKDILSEIPPLSRASAFYTHAANVNDITLHSKLG